MDIGIWNAYLPAFPPTVQEGSLFSTPLPDLLFIDFFFFNDGHPDQCEVIPYCNFDLHFSNNERHWASFHVCWPFISLLYKNVCLGLLPIFWLGCLVFWYWAAWVACNILEVNPLSVVSFVIIFSHSEGCRFILFIVSFAVQKLLSVTEP